MAATTVSVVTVICDRKSCKKQIANGEYIVSLGDVGLTFHRECFAAMSAGELMSLSGDDETLVYKLDANGAAPAEQARVRHAEKITATSHPTSEMVSWPI